jgi:hypothetical protein
MASQLSRPTVSDTKKAKKREAPLASLFHFQIWLKKLAATGFNFDLHARDKVHGHFFVNFAHLQLVSAV